MYPIVYDMMRAETTAAAEYGTADGDNHAIPVMYADDLNVLAPADDIDAAAAIHRNYPGELTGGTACCTSMSVAEIEAYLVRRSGAAVGACDLVAAATSMVHAAAAAAARGLAGAIKEYCLRRLADRYIVWAVEMAPPLVPRPDS